MGVGLEVKDQEGSKECGYLLSEISLSPQVLGKSSTTRREKRK